MNQGNLRQIFKSIDAREDELISEIRNLALRPLGIGRQAYEGFFEPEDLILELLESSETRIPLRMVTRAFKFLLRELLNELSREELPVRTEYARRLIRMAILTDATSVSEEVYELVESVNIINSEAGKQLYSAIMGCLQTARVRMSASWWQTQIRRSPYAQLAISAYVGLEGWEALLSLTAMAQCKHLELLGEDFLALADGVRRHIGSNPTDVGRLFTALSRYDLGLAQRFANLVGPSTIAEVAAMYCEQNLRWLLAQFGEGFIDSANQGFVVHLKI